MDALSNLGVNWQSLVSQIVNFLILLLLLRYFLYKPILNMLEQRKIKIEQGLADAERAKSELEKTEKKSKEIIKSANKKSVIILGEAQKQAKVEIVKATDEAKQKSQKIIESAKHQAETEKATITARARTKIAEVVIVATEKIIQEKYQTDSIEKIINSINE